MSKNNYANDSFQDGFLSLPAEIRNRIYEYALIRDEVFPYEYFYRMMKTQVPVDDAAIFTSTTTSTYDPKTSILHVSRPGRSDPPAVALLSTCKQIRAEGRGILFSRNTWVFRHHETAFAFWYKTAQEDLDEIRDVKLILEFGEYMPYDVGDILVGFSEAPLLPGISPMDLVPDGYMKIDGDEAGDKSEVLLVAHQKLIRIIRAMRNLQRLLVSLHWPESLRLWKHGRKYRRETHFKMMIKCLNSGCLYGFTPSLHHYAQGWVHDKVPEIFIDGVDDDADSRLTRKEFMQQLEREQTFRKFGSDGISFECYTRTKEDQICDMGGKIETKKHVYEMTADADMSMNNLHEPIFA